MNEKLKEEMEKEKYKYDFRYIKQSMNFTDEDKVYLEEGDLDLKIKAALTSNEVLNVFQDHKFSMNYNHAISVFYKLTKLIPVDKYTDMKMGEYKLRNPNDPRFTDRRMQALLSMLKESMDKMTGQQKVIVLYAAVKLR